ncbi:hypothetical protein K490DRAFT_70835 [Saccharata proteae CBS 121410]|uniref:Deacetylase complex subunit n=1 Tax=Saccharata proteae CBS 121410 TaxID=1314787 RepID=A0A9P4LZ21_9PEZI|nr:hypothetical protein K490DRAFT_70835 [Saccharata proteae CBS 121410]
MSPSGDIPLGHSAVSPPPLPQPSKRDKRRTMLADKFNDMVSNFSDNRDQHYRAQIGAVQHDMNLIIQADPYLNKPLDDTGDEVAEHVAQTTGPNAPAAGTPAHDYAGQVGRFYSQFVNKVNDALEERDINLTMLSHKHQASLDELHQTHQYKVMLAQEEHRQLANTIRERLMATIKHKQVRLLKEKEQLDIADSNSLLLHPNQFTITNPASPGGPGNHRKTRHTRHAKVGDPDDASGPTVDKTRKRKAAFEDNDDSPTPAGRNVDAGFASPFRDAKSKTIHTQYEAPAYSIDRLFTDKELAMTMNHAALATSHFFAKLKSQDQQREQRQEQQVTNGTANGTSADTVMPDATHEADPAAATPDDSTPAAPEMERTQSYHATRGSTRTNPLADLALAAERTSTLPFAPSVAPVILPANVGTKANASAPTPPGLSNADVDHDFALMARPTDGSDDLNEKLLKAAVAPLRTRQYQLMPPGAVREEAGPPAGTRGILPQGIDYAAMSAGNSVAGAASVASEAAAPTSAPAAATGGVAMSRTGNGSSLGGVEMRRTASGRGRGRGRGAH